MQQQHFHKQQRGQQEEQSKSTDYLPTMTSKGIQKRSYNDLKSSDSEHGNRNDFNSNSHVRLSYFTGPSSCCLTHTILHTLILSLDTHTVTQKHPSSTTAANKAPCKNDTCPVCSEMAYGLMALCHNCKTPFHSICLPFNQRTLGMMKIFQYLTIF